MSKALVVLRKGQRLTANQNRCVYHRFEKVEEIYTPSARSLVPADAALFLPSLRLRVNRGYGYLDLPPPDHVVFTAEEPFLLRYMSYWAGTRSTHDTRSEGLVKLLYTPDIGPGGEAADSGWVIV